MTEAQLVRLAAEGSIPPKDVAHWRAPPSGEVSPHSRSDEVVTFRIFYAQGLGHPAHPFLLGLLEGWKIELHHLNPTGMLHIAGFVTVCEAFLGIDPHVDLFREMFVGRPVTLRRDAGASRLETTIAPVGGFGLQRRPGKTSYPRYTPVDNNRGWHDEWFYIRNPPSERRRSQCLPGTPRRSGRVGLGGPPGGRRIVWR